MKIITKKEIIIERERTFTIRYSSAPARRFCHQCDALVEMLPINEAARLMKKNWREIVSVIDSGAIHSSETMDGEIYLCLASLLAEDGK